MFFDCNGIQNNCTGNYGMFIILDRCEPRAGIMLSDCYVECRLLEDSFDQY